MFAALGILLGISIAAAVASSKPSLPKSPSWVDAGLIVFILTFFLVYDRVKWWAEDFMVMLKEIWDEDIKGKPQSGEGRHRANGIEKCRTTSHQLKNWNTSKERHSKSGVSTIS